MSTTDWTPTHRITLDSGEVVLVELIDGAAYTREEAGALCSADYERQEDGSWTFQGQPFSGTVAPA